jgi:hypothetical protein
VRPVIQFCSAESCLKLAILAGGLSALQSVEVYCAAHTAALSHWSYPKKRAQAERIELLF